eukprot:CAMPEP_0206603254 /NCGR_PEP_ID=MMETSP0325_2-20121206/48202_1 /ASSEMBLY_ACC=CAM_ASM_000347 /TAXON_ID=2866 /ORGANISM="Crypthecodinium cohnii, Strain Seligo" /LENGTH=41 /DNA_ID= /DNA_START= /DNA_END= /DNA_ORIENTATION=
MATPQVSPSPNFAFARPSPTWAAKWLEACHLLPSHGPNMTS